MYTVNTTDSVITDEDVYWEMTWGPKYPDKPPTETMFEEEKGLARLLAEEVVFLNSHWYEKSWPEKAQRSANLLVNCNDVFAWGCADCEAIEYGNHEIQSLYDAWFKDRVWGPAKWCALKRNQQPQGPIIDAMKKAGSWDDVMEALGANTLDAETQAHIAQAVALSRQGSTTDAITP